MARRTPLSPSTVTDRDLLVTTSTILNQLNKRMFGETGDGGFAKDISVQHVGLRDDLSTGLAGVQRTISERDDKIDAKFLARDIELKKEFEKRDTDIKAMSKKVWAWSGGLAVLQIVLSILVAIIIAKLRHG